MEKEGTTTKITYESCKEKGFETHLTNYERVFATETALDSEPEQEVFRLARNIEEELTKKGLNNGHNNIGLNRFILFSKRNILEASKGNVVKIPQKGPDIILDLRERNKRAKGLVDIRDKVNVGTFVWVHPYYDPSGKKGEIVMRNQEPPTVAQQLSMYSLETGDPLKITGIQSLTNNYISTLIHESQHANNAKSGLSPTKMGEILQECSSELAINIAFNIEDDKLSNLFDNSASPVLKRDIVHERLFEKPTETKEQLAYGVSVVWQLKALGYEEAEAGKIIAWFNDTNKTNWDQEKKVCSKIEEWLALQWLHKGIDSLPKIKEEVNSYKLKVKKKNEETWQVVQNSVKSHLSNLDLNGTISILDTGTSSKLDTPNIQLQRGQMLTMTFYNFSPLFKIIDLNKMSSVEIPTETKIDLPERTIRQILESKTTSVLQNTVSTLEIKIQKGEEMSTVQKNAIEMAKSILQKRAKEN